MASHGNTFNEKLQISLIKFSKRSSRDSWLPSHDGITTNARGKRLTEGEIKYINKN